jgi:hypothetical protein
LGPWDPGTTSRTIPLLLGAAGSAALGAAVALLPWPAPALLLVAAIGAFVVWLCLADPSRTVWLMLALLFFGNRTEIPALYFWGRYLPTAALALFLFCVLVRRLGAGRLAWRGRQVVVALLPFLVLLLVSSFYNASSPRDLVLSLVTNLRYPLFFTALLTARFPPAFYTRILSAFVLLTVLQAPVAIGQYATGLKSDFLAGTLGTNGNLIAVVLVTACALTARWIVTRRSALSLVIGLLALLVPILLGDVQTALFFGPAVIVWIVFRHYGAARSLAVVRRAVPVLAALGAIVILAVVTSPDIRRFLRTLPDNWVNVQKWADPVNVSNSSVGRFVILVPALPILAEDPLRLLWGFGPEAASGGLIHTSGLQSALVATVNMSDMGAACQALARRGYACREAQVFKSVMEFGVVGTLLYLFTLVIVWRGAWCLARISPSGRARALALLLDGVALFYVVLAFPYAGVWRLDAFSLPFWLIAAAVHAELRAIGPGKNELQGVIVA